METILAQARAAGAQFASWTLLRLPYEVKDLFQEWLAEAVPARAARVMSLVRSMRGGKDYDSAWKTRGRGTGPIADTVRERFRLARKRLGYAEKIAELDCSRFRVPDTLRPVRVEDRQMSLF